HRVRELVQQDRGEEEDREAGGHHIKLASDVRQALFDRRREPDHDEDRQTDRTRRNEDRNAERAAQRQPRWGLAWRLVAGCSARRRRAAITAHPLMLCGTTVRGRVRAWRDPRPSSRASLQESVCALPYGHRCRQDKDREGGGMDRHTPAGVSSRSLSSSPLPSSPLSSTGAASSAVESTATLRGGAPPPTPATADVAPSQA